MGMYTEIFVDVAFQSNVPIKIIHGLYKMKYSYLFDPLKEQHITTPWIFKSKSYYTTPTCCFQLKYDPILETYTLLAKGSIKNYRGEIEDFFKLISPHVNTPFMGYLRYEENYTPTMVFSDSVLQKTFLSGNLEEDLEYKTL